MSTSASSSIFSRLQALREKAAAETVADLNPNSELAAVPTSLTTLIILYHKAHSECCIDHSEGLKSLVNWLSPIEFDADRFPDILNPGCRVPRILTSWSLYDLAKIITTGNTATVCSCSSEAEAQWVRAIYFHTVYEAAYTLY